MELHDLPYVRHRLIRKSEQKALQHSTEGHRQMLLSLASLPGLLVLRLQGLPGQFLSEDWHSAIH